VSNVELVGLQDVTAQQWRELIAGEREPWGGGAEHLSWADKTRVLGLRARDGRLVAVAGSLIAEVEVEGSGAFEVLGIGALFVTRTERGRGLAGRLLEGLLADAGRTAPGVKRAMLFCRDHLVGLYEGYGFNEIRDPVWADQPGGRIEMPMRAMWRGLSDTASWPRGRVQLRGRPF
jgi:predicted GNAT family N-acyltransferase